MSRFLVQVQVGQPSKKERFLWGIIRIYSVTGSLRPRTSLESMINNEINKEKQQ